MRRLRKAIGIAAVAIYILVVLILCGITWEEYANGYSTLSRAISQTVFLLGLPLFLAVGFALPELVLHALDRLLRKLFGKGTRDAP